MKKLAIRDLPKIERPREKLLRYGAKKLEIEELVAILLRRGNRNHKLSELSAGVTRLLKAKSQNKEELEYIDVKGISGIGNVQCIEVLAFVELANRLSESHSTSPLTPQYIFQDLFEIRGTKKENFYAYYLDSRNCLIKKELISVGTVDASLVHPREVFEPAIKISAVSVIVSHNHPSRNINPSDADIEITEILRECGELLGIKLLDHIIVSKEDYYSFKENSLLL